MPNKDYEAVSGYTQDSSATGSEEPEPEPEPDTEAGEDEMEEIEEIVVEADKYGIAKPQRVVIRAKVTHDKD